MNDTPPGPGTDAETPLRVAIVAPPWFSIPPEGYGGIESMVFWLAEGLVARGHDVTLIAAAAASTNARFRATFTEPPSDQLGEAVLEVVHAARARNVIHDVSPDVVHDHSVAGPLLAGEGYRTILTAHGPVTGEFLHYYQALANQVRLVAISESQRNLAPELPWSATVHNGIPVADYPFRRDKEDFLLFLGRMSPTKGAHLAIEASRAAGHRLVLAAKCNEPEEIEYFETEVKPRLGEDTEWLGEVDQDRKRDLLARARCLVFPIQWHEPFGLVMVEAMACGTPVVACDGGSVREIVEDDVTGCVCEDSTGLADAIDKAGQVDPHACRERAESRFDVDVMVGGYERLYRRAALGVPGGIQAAR